MIKLANIKDIPEGGRLIVSLPKGKEIVLFKIKGEVFALDNACPHMGGPLGEGEIEDGIVVCPWHGWQFDIKTGECINVPGDDASRIPSPSAMVKFIGVWPDSMIVLKKGRAKCNKKTPFFKTVILSGLTPIIRARSCSRNSRLHEFLIRRQMLYKYPLFLLRIIPSCAQLCFISDGNEGRPDDLVIAQDLADDAPSESDGLAFNNEQ